MADNLCLDPQPAWLADSAEQYTCTVGALHDGDHMTLDGEGGKILASWPRNHEAIWRQIVLARDLRGDADGENPEYDRALVELIACQLGGTDEWRGRVEDLIGIPATPELDKTSPYDMASWLHGVIYDVARSIERTDETANLADAQVNPISVRTNNIAQFMLRLRNGKLFRISIMDGFEQDWLSTIERDD